MWEEEESLLDDIVQFFDDMDEELYVDMIVDMGEYPLELRLAHLMLYTADADWEVSDDEEDVLKDHLKVFLTDMGIDRKAKKVLKKAYKLLEDEALLEESVDLLGSYLPNETLASFTNILIDIAAADEFVEEEENFLYQLMQRWQL